MTTKDDVNRHTLARGQSITTDFIGEVEEGVATGRGAVSIRDKGTADRDIADDQGEIRYEGLAGAGGIGQRNPRGPLTSASVKLNTANG